MSPAILLALTAMAFGTGNDLVYRKASMVGRSSGPLPFTFLASATSTGVAFLILLVGSAKGGGVAIGTTNLLYGLAVGSLSFLAYILYLNSFTGDNTAVCVTIFRMNMVPSVVFAMIFLGEALSLQRGAAIFLCICSVLLLGSWNTGIPTDRRALWMSLGAFLIGAILNVINKVAVANGGDPVRLLIVRFGVVAVLSAATMLVRKSFRFDRRTVKYSLASGLFLMLAIYFVLQAYKVGDLGLVLPITQLSFALVVVISWIFLKERINAAKIIGFCLAVGSVLLMR